MKMRNNPVLIFFCLLLSAAAVLAGVNIYSELKERQKEKEDFAAVSQIAEPTVTAEQTESEQAEPTEEPAAERNIPALIAAKYGLYRMAEYRRHEYLLSRHVHPS